MSFTRDALKLQVEGDYISAQGTTLEAMMELLLPMGWRFSR